MAHSYRNHPPEVQEDLEHIAYDLLRVMPIYGLTEEEYNILQDPDSYIVITRGLHEGFMDPLHFNVIVRDIPKTFHIYGYDTGNYYATAR